MTISETIVALADLELPGWLIYCAGSKLYASPVCNLLCAQVHLQKCSQKSSAALLFSSLLSLLAWIHFKEGFHLGLMNIINFIFHRHISLDPSWDLQALSGNGVGTPELVMWEAEVLLLQPVLLLMLLPWVQAGAVHIMHIAAVCLRSWLMSCGRRVIFDLFPSVSSSGAEMGKKI